MDTIDISTTTPVQHKDGGHYRITSVGGSDSGIDRIDIARTGHGHVFTGSPGEAIAQGFSFPDPIVERPTPEVLAERIDALTGRVGQLETDLAAATQAVEQWRDRAFKSERELDTFKSTVRDAAIEHAAQQDHCNDGLNEWLEALGLDPVRTDWDVEVSSAYGNVLATVRVSGDDADDEDAACEYVKEKMEADLGDTTIPMEGTIYGSEGSESFSYDYEVDGYSMPDGLIEQFIESLSFEATPAE